MISQLRSRRKPTGGRYKASRKKRLTERGRLPALTKPGENAVKYVKTRGGNMKMKLTYASTANVFDRKTKAFKVAKFTIVIENNANRQFVRRNILTKGAVIDTELGKARVTNRPGQEGYINAELV
ncbi:MAG: 30S ribosomal protein S8e [Candidatus Woesearchaeota archaeon]